MKSGVYRKVEGHTGVGLFYQFLHLARHHTTGEESVVYIPLRVESEWAGTVRPCILDREAFEKKFEYVGEGLPRTSARAEVVSDIIAAEALFNEIATLAGHGKREAAVQAVLAYGREQRAAARKEHRDG